MKAETQQSHEPSQKRRKTMVWMLIALAIVASIWIKVRLEAGLSVEQAATFDEKGQTEFAILCYRRTVRWYSPASGPVEQSVDRLWNLGQEMEEAGHLDKALLAYRALRSALFGIRSFYQPFESKLAPTSERIAILMAGQEGLKDQTPAFDSAVEKHKRLLMTDHAPSVFWSALAVISFLLWCWCLFSIALQCFDEKTGAILRTPALKWGGFAGLAIIVWLLALSQA